MKTTWMIVTYLIGIIPVLPWIQWQERNGLLSITTNLVVIVVWCFGFVYLSLSLYNKIYLGCFGIGCAS